MSAEGLSRPFGSPFAPLCGSQSFLYGLEQSSSINRAGRSSISGPNPTRQALGLKAVVWAEPSDLTRQSSRAELADSQPKLLCFRQAVHIVASVIPIGGTSAALETQATATVTNTCKLRPGVSFSVRPSLCPVIKSGQRDKTCCLVKIHSQY